jgi:tetrapyrrole methylase family protein/MazG family protein
VAEATSPEIVRRAREQGIPVRVIEGLSFLEPVFTALELDPFPFLTMMDAIELGQRYQPPFPPSSPLMVTQIYSRMIASEVKMTLSSVYPDEILVKLVHHAGTDQCLVQEIPLYQIDRQDEIGLRTVLYVPPMSVETSFEEFQEIIARLRAPDGCPWDREQTHLSLRRYLLEESYELMDALDNEDPEKTSEELGDLLLQILLHAQIGLEEGEFTMADVLAGINRKIVRRHPHVFGDAAVKGAEGVVQAWEKIKAQERIERSENNSAEGLLMGVPASLPALSQAQEIQIRAARVGFDWDEIAPVFAKVLEEFNEVKEAGRSPRVEAEIGDLMFAVVNLARWLKVDAEIALRSTNTRFKKRFEHIEKRAAETGKLLTDMTLEEMDRFWDEAKLKE